MRIVEARSIHVHRIRRRHRFDELEGAVGRAAVEHEDALDADIDQVPNTSLDRLDLVENGNDGSQTHDGIVGPRHLDESR